MISPYESANGRGAGAGVAARLLPPGTQTVSRLEFVSLDYEHVDEDVVEEVLTVKPEVRVKEEMEMFDGRLKAQAEEARVLLETARSEARSEARQEWEQELEERIAEERTLLLKANDDFQRERRRYFAEVEAELVKLSLAIAKRVLHREAKLDPLLLAGVVRVALDKLAKGSATVLRVPAEELGMWSAVFAMDTDATLQVAGDKRLSAGECVLDTNVGTVELGVSAQLDEIERGFFDLLQQRPA
ncbi:FliH/SctL family protein [Granulicella sp. L60]|jgi:flagellar assembly protein FliH|uniref:FliH/SctL family protein n=1 Tax=Granulicella sp. L60 TaxID=1641866 RepID=UPI00131CC12B|nr:FliH/SctL family protein [Granulicella sp. L60]